MTWEEYQATDFYRESHRDDRSQREREEDLLYTFMKRYMDGIEDWEQRNAEFRKTHHIDNDDEQGIDDDFIDNDGNLHHVIYFVLRKYGSRTTGCITYGDFKHCWKAIYEYDVKCIKSEWDYATLKREEIIVDNVNDLQEEIENTIDGYRELSYCDPYDYYYDEY